MHLNIITQKVLKIVSNNTKIFDFDLIFPRRMITVNYFISSIGNLIRTTIENISVIGRNTQGVKLIRLYEEDKLLEMEPIINDSNDD